MGHMLGDQEEDGKQAASSAKNKRDVCVQM
jgi:hypothetical protein